MTKALPSGRADPCKCRSIIRRAESFHSFDRPLFEERESVVKKNKRGREIENLLIRKPLRKPLPPFNDAISLRAVLSVCLFTPPRYVPNGPVCLNYNRDIYYFYSQKKRSQVHVVHAQMFHIPFNHFVPSK